MQNCVGSPVRNEDFFPRPIEVEALWKAIKAGGHIFVAAPRRVGKTSILMKLLDDPHDGYAVVYISTESADNENEFWQKLFHGLINQEFVGMVERYSKKIAASLMGVIKNIKRIDATGVEFGDGVQHDHAAAFKELIKNLEIDKKIVIMIDEFPQTVENIIECEGEKSARSFLKRNRELRHSTWLGDKIVFIYTGSIGLESIATKLGGVKFINDLNRIQVMPLTMQDADQFIGLLMAGQSLVINGDIKKYLIEKIEWLIPFYIQLIVQEISTLCKQQKIERITSTEIIDKAILESLNHKNHFEHWHQRLKCSFDTTAYKYAKEILTIISLKKTIDSASMADLAVKYGIPEDGKEIIHSLVYDGYINNNDIVQTYRFNSPILRMWWEKNVAN